LNSVGIKPGRDFYPGVSMADLNDKPAIIFDFGDVLIAWKFEYLYRKLFKTEAEVQLFLKKSGLREMNRRFDAGYPFDKGIAELIALHPEYTSELTCFRPRWMEAMGELNHEVIELIGTLKQMGYRVYGLSNWSRETFNLVKDGMPFLLLLDDYLISGDAGVAKPDERIYLMLLERIGRKAEECVFIDDSEENINSARNLGFSIIHYTTPQKLMAEFFRFGIEASK
jgi:2-haloacid dehalogenase